MADPHWRNTANDVKFWIFDAKAFSPFPLLLIIKSLFLLIFGLFFLFFFFIIDKRGLSFSNFLRRTRTQITGSVKSVRRINL